jgi:hypothetical protein
MTLTLKPHDLLPDPRMDPVFKALFTQNTPNSKNALKALLSAFIGRAITALSLSQNEPPPLKHGDKQIRYDISCKFNTGELADIEMTLFPGPSENLRCSRLPRNTRNCAAEPHNQWITKKEQRKGRRSQQTFFFPPSFSLLSPNSSFRAFFVIFVGNLLCASLAFGRRGRPA